MVQLLKFGLAALSVLLLTHCCGGQVQVVGPLQPVVVIIGEDVVLPCHLNPAADASGMTFEWARPDLNPRFVHVWHKSQDLHVNQHPSYKGRTSVSVSRLKQGDISLKLSKVRLSDEGGYRCYLPDSERDVTVQLVVGTASLPVITLAGMDKSSSGAVLDCESKGWYPEPEVSWLDGEGHVLSAGPPETVRGPDGLYTVSSRVTVEKRHGNRFTCRVHQKTTNQTRETQIHVGDDLFVAPPSSAPWIALSVISFFTCVLSVVFAVWTSRRNKTKTKTKQRDTEKLLEENEKKTAEELRRKAEEHKAMVDVLKKQRDTLKQQHQKVEKQVEDNYKEEKEAEKDKSEAGYNKLKKIISKYRGEQRETEKALDQLVLETEKVLENIQAETVGTREQMEAENQEEPERVKELEDE